MNEYEIEAETPKLMTENATDLNKLNKTPEESQAFGGDTDDIQVLIDDIEKEIEVANSIDTIMKSSNNDDELPSNLINAIKFLEREIIDIEKVIAIIIFLYKIGTSFTNRVGIKGIFESLTNRAITSSEKTKLKKLFEVLKLTPYKSGEYPIVANLEDYKYLKYAIFDEKFSQYSVKEDMKIEEFSTSEEYWLYKAAYDDMIKKFYFGMDMTF